MLNNMMVRNGIKVMTCNRCIIFSFLPEARGVFLCMKCKLVAILEEELLF